MNDKVQAALKAREEEKKKKEQEQDPKRSKVAEALAARDNRMKSDLSTVASDWEKRINTEIEAYNKHISSSAWGADFLNSSRQNSISTTKLIDEISAYRKYLGDEKTDEILSGLNSIKNSYNLRSSFGSEDEYNSYVEERKAIDAILNSEDFEEYYNLGLNVENPSYEDATGTRSFWSPLLDKMNISSPLIDSIKGKEATPVTNMVTFAEKYYNDAMIDSASGMVDGSGASNPHATLVANIHQWMTEDEKKVYNYYVGKGDAQKAEEYLNGLKDKFEQRAAGDLVTKWDDTASELIFSLVSGANQAFTGLGNLDNLINGTEGDSTTNRLNYAYGQMSSNNEGIWKVANDLAQTTGNMLPSIAVSSATGVPLFGAVLMGVSSAGNSYSEMRSLGYSANQARAYGVMVGASEAALQYAIGGISKLGGKAVDKLAGDLIAKCGTKLTTALAGINNGIARVAIKYGGQMGLKMGSEAFEEATQSVLEPIFKHIVTLGEEDIDIDWENVVYSGILGALSAGFLEGGTTLAGTIYNDVSTTKYGQSLIDKGSVPELQSLAREMMGVSKETDMLSIQAKTNQTAHNVGEFALSLGNSVKSQNLTEVTNALVEKGLSQKETQKVAEKLINNESLSKKQMSNDAIKAVAEEVVNNPASSMNERKAKFRNAQVGVKTNASETQPGEVAVNKKVDVTDRVSADGVTKQTSTGEAITIDKSNPIAKTKDGKVYFNTDRGVVESSDVSYASADEGLIYEAFVDMNPAFANALIRNYDGKTPVQSYIKGMREGLIIYGRHNFQGIGKDISGATYFAELSEADQAFALKLGRNYAAYEAKVKDAPVRQMLREATKRAEASNTEGANKTAKTGTVGFEKGINKHLLNKEQRGVVELANHLVKALGIDIVFYDARTKKEGENGYNDNGFYDPETNTIHLDLQKSHYDNKTIAYTLSHELVHWLKAKSATDFNNFAKFLMEQYAEHGVDTENLLDKWIEKGYTADEAYEEMICDACETLLLDSNAVVKLMKLREQDMGLFERIKLHIAEILNKLRNMYKKYDDRLSDEAKALRSMTDVLEQIYEKFEDAMVGAAKNAEVMGVSMEFTVNDAMTGTDISDITKKPTVKMQEKTEYFKFPKEVIKITKSGSERTPMDIKINGKRFTGEASVRELRNARFAENKFDPKIVEKINNFLDKMKDYLVEAREKYVYVGLKDIYEAKIIISPTTGSIVLSGLVNNGDYEINFDFTKTCKKKIALQEVIEQLAREKGTKNEDGTQTEVNLSEENIRHINEVLAANGIETACLCCFVESKRYAIQSHFQEKVCDVWNRLVDEVNAEDGITKEAPYFNFADQNVNDSKIPDAEYDRLYADLDRWRNYKFEDDGEGEGAVERKMKAFLINTPNARKKLRLADFVTESGRTNLHKLYPDIESLAKAKIGTALPKAIEAFAPYNGEIELLEVSGKEDLATYAMKIAGARSQSFSDYLMSHVYDVLQKTASLSARKLTAHTYTKEISRARLFGMTGEKTNMSVLHEIDPKVDSWNAGLHEDGSYFVSDYEAFKNKKCGQIQSIPDAESIALQNTDGYSKDCGRIGVGFSYTHMLKMHNDPDIRQTIGYHSSSLPLVLKPLTNLDKATDYTPVQNTLNFNGFRKPNFDIPDGIPSYATPPQDIEPWFKTTSKGKQSTQRMSKYSKSDATFDIKGKYAELCETMDSTKAAKETLRQLLQFAEDNGLALVTSKYKKGGRGDFDLYTDTQKTQNPYLSADHYIEYCISNGLIPMFYEFALNDNYYKDIYDFNPFDRLSYNPETGLHEDSADRKAYAPQNPVHMVNEDGTMAFPDDFWELVDKYMKDYNYQREDFKKKFPKIMKEVRAIKDAEGIPMVSKSGIKKQVKKQAKKSEQDSAYLDAVNHGDMETAQRMVDEAAKEAGYDSPKLYHGTKMFGFTEVKTSGVEKGFDWSPFFAANKEDISASYVPHGKVRDISSSMDEDAIEEAREIAIEERKENISDLIDDFRHLIDKHFSPWVFGQTDNSYLEKLVEEANPEAGNGDGVYDVLSDIVCNSFYDYQDEFGEYEDYDDWADNSPEGKEIFSAITEIEGEKSALYRLESGEELGGIYQLYAKLDNMYVVDGKGVAWNELRPEGLPKLERYGVKDAPYKTRDVAEWARDNGFDGVIFKNIRDNGAYGRTPAGDVYAFFRPESQVKSADLVTYDDNGNVIPLSERFNTKNKDIRHQAKKNTERILMGSLFSGGGTLEAGLVYQMLDKEFAVEYKASLASAYTDNFGKEHMFVGDVRDFNSKEKRNVFYLHASPVCKSYSPANHSGGERNDDIITAQATARVLEEQMPEVFTVENVKQYRGSEAYNIIVNKLNELGYTWDVDVYKASDYGNATKRERMIIRAVKNGELPAKPQKVSNITSWGEATKDLWKTDLIPSTLVKSKYEAIKNTPELRGINLTKLDKPLMIYDTTKRKTITFAWADELSPTLTTKCGDARIIMPDGIVYAPTPKFMGRIQGLPDNYKYPKATTNAFKIIGNGIPTQLTKAVIGGVLDSAYMQTHDGKVLHQKKRESNRTILANALETTIDTSTQAGQNELKKLKEYQGVVAELDNLEVHLADVMQQIHDISFTKGSDRSKLTALNDDKIKTQNRIHIYDKRLTNLESMKPIKDVLAREKEAVRVKTEAKAKEAFDAYKKQIQTVHEADIGRERAEKKAALDKLRERMNEKLKDQRLEMRESQRKAVANVRETQAKKDAKKKLQALVLDTIKWITHPDKTDVRCPDMLKAPYKAFLDSINFDSERALNGGERTKNDLRMDAAMNSLANTIDKLRTEQLSEDGDANGFLDIPGSMVQTLRDMADNITNSIGALSNLQYLVNRLPSDQLKQLTKLIGQLNRAIKTMNTLHGNLRFANAQALGFESITFLNSMGEAESTNSVKNFVHWDNALPYYAFKRFGEAGISIFEELMDAQDKMAYNSKAILDFKENSWTDKEANEWSNDTHTIYLPSGGSVTLTTADAMGIYCLSRRDDNHGMNHLLGGGIRVVGLTKGATKAKDSIATLTIVDVEEIVDSLTDRQKEVAVAIQGFMSTVCSDWGNEISMKRFLTNDFLEKDYYPIESDDENLNSELPEASQGDLYRLLNISATKSLTKGANNRVIIRNIFDVFTNHTSDMARLNAYGMALLDYMKWINYREKIVDPDGKIHTRGVRQSMRTTYGDKKPIQYVLNLIKDINGRHTDNGDNPFLMKMMRLGKTASVGFNLRVALLQFTSYPRAAMVLSKKSLAKGLTKVPNIKKAEQYCGIALWKSFGFYDTNIARSIEDQIKGATNIQQKIIELSMTMPGIADAITWGALWNACEYEVSQSTTNEVGSEEFYQEVGKKLREVVYATQVVDSVLTRSQIMRSKSGITQMVTAYMGEPTLTANILMDAGFEFEKAKRTTGSKKTAWEKTRKIIFKAVGNYCVLQLIASLAESLADAWRDDEDEEFGEKFKSAFAENLITNIIPFNKIPIISDVVETILSFFGIGYATSDNMATTWLVQIADAVKVWGEVLGENFGGDETSKTVYNAIYKTAKALSSVTGISVSGAMREVVALWNNTAGAYDSTLKLRIYESSNEELGNELYEAILEGDERQANSLRAKFEDEDAINSALRKALRDNDSRIKEAALADIEGNVSEYDRIVSELLEEGYFTENNIKGAITSEINSLTEDEDESGGSSKKKSVYDTKHYGMAIEDGNISLANKIKEDIIETHIENGKSRDAAESAFESSLRTYYRDEYKDGNISRTKATSLLITYGGLDSNETYWKLKEWDYYIANGTTEGYSKYTEFYEAVRTGSNLKTVINEHLTHGADKSDLASQITKYYKPLYKEMSNSERASLKGYLLNAYVLLGYNRTEKSKDIDNWLKD